MLSYEQANDLLEAYGSAAAWIRHCHAVAAVADRFAGLLAPHYPLDADYLRVGALLHDIGRYRTHDPIQHGVEGYRLLTGLGHHREAFICASHVLCGLPSAEAVRYGLPEQDFLPRTIEERLVPLIDSMVERDRPTTLDERFRSIFERYQGNDHFLRRFEQAAGTARRFLDELNRVLGVSLEQVAAETLGNGRGR